MEQAVLIGVTFGRKDKERITARLVELENLARTAGAEVVEKITQDRERPDSRYFVGTGFLMQLRAAVDEKSADLIIFLNNLTPAQSRNVEEELGVKVINRTELILDIFAQHARTKEGSLQVQIA